MILTLLASRAAWSTWMLPLLLVPSALVAVSAGSRCTAALSSEVAGPVCSCVCLALGPLLVCLLPACQLLHGACPDTLDGCFKLLLLA